MLTFEKLGSFIVKPWVMLSYLGFCMVSFFCFDKPVAYYFYQLHLKQQAPVLYWMTCLGIGSVYIVALFLWALFFRYILKNKIWEWRSWFLWLCVVGPNLICLVLKMLLGRARPTLLFTEQLYGFYGFHKSSLFWSLPSGHTTTIMGLMFGLSILFSRFIYIWLSMGFLLIVTRVILTDHYLSDVMFTAYLTGLEVLLLVYISRRQGLLEKCT